MARWVVGIGGTGVIVALALIFIYLFYEVAPLFRSASLAPVAEYAVPDVNPEQTVHIALERYNEYAVAYNRDASVVFFRTDGGDDRESHALALPERVVPTSFAVAAPRSRLAAYGLSDGSVLIARHDYLISYPDDRRHLDPILDHPLGETPIEIDPQRQAIVALAIQETGNGFLIAGETVDGRLLVTRFTSRTNFMTGETELSAESHPLGRMQAPSRFMLINGSGRNLLIADERGVLHNYDISVPANAVLKQSKRVVPEGRTVTAMNFLTGTLSFVIGGSDGSVAQWYLVRDEENIYHITRVREFRGHSAPVTGVIPEMGRRGFITTATDGTLGVHYGTSHATVLTQNILDGAIAAAAVSPVNTAMLLLDGEANIRRYDYDNPHPEVSWSSLWGKVWYEGRGQEEYVWQASSGSDEFEPKFSLVPLSVGTLKAAFFAMLFAMPLAIMGAIYTAYFMTPKLRGKVKPTIEVMEALPTVILGFLAGLWLAPFIETNIPAVFSILLLMPLASRGIAVEARRCTQRSGMLALSEISARCSTLSASAISLTVSLSGAWSSEGAAGVRAHAAGSRAACTRPWRPSRCGHRDLCESVCASRADRGRIGMVSSVSLRPSAGAGVEAEAPPHASSCCGWRPTMGAGNCRQDGGICRHGIRGKRQGL
jgi:phosphate transport system permease protein